MYKKKEIIRNMAVSPFCTLKLFPRKEYSRGSQQKAQIKINCRALKKYLVYPNGDIVTYYL